MIILYSGIPGSGKSYKMVHDLVEVQEKFYVVHNIDGLKPDFLKHGINFVDYCAENVMEVTDFLSKDYQIQFSEEVRRKYGLNCLVIVDEAHEWFDKNKRSLKMWLSYHRHLNQTIWMVAHRSTNLPAIYRSFIELEFRAKHSSILSLPGRFMYSRIVAGERVGYTTVKKKQAVFDLYKSQAEGFKKKRASMLIPVLLLLAVLGVAAFIYVPQRVIGKGAKKAEGAPVSDKTPAVVSRLSEQDAPFRYVGKVGNEVLLEDLDGRIVLLRELEGLFLLMLQREDYVKLFDVQKGKTITVSRFRTTPSTRFPTTEGNGLKGNGKKA